MSTSATLEHHPVRFNAELEMLVVVQAEQFEGSRQSDAVVWLHDGGLHRRSRGARRHHGELGQGPPGQWPVPVRTAGQPDRQTTHAVEQRGGGVVS